jgi:putative tryptophan/tyrosine transport system substrate-binding protein
VKRREFIAGLGSAAAWPVVVRAQRVTPSVIGLLSGNSSNSLSPYLPAFRKGLSEVGFKEGDNISFEYRWADDRYDQLPALAADLVRRQVAVIVAVSTPAALAAKAATASIPIVFMGTPATAALQRDTRTIPIVFAGVPAPVGEGFVAGLPRPGGNMTGFSNLEASMGGKWLQLLMEVTPGIKRVAIMFNPDTAAGGGSYFLPSFEAAARSLKVEPIIAPIHDDAEIEMVITSLGREPRGGLVAMPDGFMISISHRTRIISLAARNNLPAVYSVSVWAKDGGLLSYGPDFLDIFRRSASYVDRIFRGEKPADLPVQLPVKFEMAINVKTAKALSLTVPQSILLRADEVIE